MVEKSVMMVIIILLIKMESLGATEQVALFFLRLFSLARLFSRQVFGGGALHHEKVCFFIYTYFIHT